ncbi:hypothetical protein DFH06DRAFT_977847 [Mycena polygramma]|nr:hypothetical protein DFH06DRAFT_971593 [Mycena polygramma]KAJ7983281.1 hypothetical protein DFH06DRAFT_977847 [Mycena polygramma]
MAAPSTNTPPSTATPPHPPPPPPPSQLPFEFATNAPSWLTETVGVLSQLDLGCHFRSVLEALIRIEHRFGFKENPQTGVTGNDRPAEIQRWIRAGRGRRQKTKYDAGVVDVAGYGRRWWTWWDSLQPEWRKRGADGKWEICAEYQKDWTWDALSFPGQNGCISVAASLYFWASSRNALGGGEEWTGEAREQWDRAVQDVVWTLEGLEQTLPEPKRKKGRGST